MKKNYTQMASIGLSATANATLSNSLAYVELAPSNVPLVFRRIQIFIATSILIAGCSLNGLLLLHLKKKQHNPNERTPPASMLIMCIAVVSSLVLLTGIPILTALLVMDFSPYNLCDYLSFAHYHILFYGNALVLNFIATVLFDRYSALTNFRFKITNHNVKRIIVIIIIYVSLAIVGMMTVRYLQGDKSSNETMFDHCHFANHLEKLKGTGESHAYGTTIIIIVLITLCNIFMARFTRKTLRYIRQVNRRTKESALGEQIQPLETKRVKVAYLIGILFDSMWIPFGIIATLQYRVDPEATGIVKVFLHLAAYASFGVFPIIYAKMDQRYINFIYLKVPCLRKNAVGDGQ